MSSAMPTEERHLRADAERNRGRLLQAAAELFSERGLDVGVAEIAQHAGVGRGTLFRNFPSKEHLIAAITVERMREVAVRGRELLDEAGPDTALFAFLDELAGRQQVDRALFEAVADEWLAHEDIRAAHREVIEALDGLLTRAQQAGAVRDDVSALDVLMMLKGVCQSAVAFAHIDPNMIGRHLDLLRAALLVQPDARPLRGRAPTLTDIEQAFPPPDGEQLKAG
jgi:AcrR family transcriptional regulator